MSRADGGWLKQHPIPSDKGSFGNFEALAQQNRRLIQQILSEDSSSVYSLSTVAAKDPYDTQLLEKIRTLYASCMNEDLLDARGSEPLLRIVQTAGDLYNGKTTVIDTKLGTLPEASGQEEKERQGLTAAIAYLHSRGGCPRSYCSPALNFRLGIDGLFSFDIDGDVGSDPNFMTLWFSQPSLGLPAKVKA